LIELAVTRDLPGHQVLYAAAADNAAGGQLHELVRRHFGDGGVTSGGSPGRLWHLVREGGSPACVQAEAEWRQFLDEDGYLLDDVAQRLAAVDTGVQQGLRAIS
jgi:hypothetical protein